MLYTHNSGLPPSVQALLFTSLQNTGHKQGNALGLAAVDFKFPTSLPYV